LVGLVVAALGRVVVVNILGRNRKRSKVSSTGCLGMHVDPSAAPALFAFGQHGGMQPALAWCC
jgi:hypothetical protein